MDEAGREGRGAPGERAALPVEREPDELPSVALAQVLAPLREEEVAAVGGRERVARVERHAVGGGVRLEVRDRWRRSGATPDEPQQPEARPADRAAEIGRAERRE